MYIVNITVRLLVLTFVLVGGAITFAGPESETLRTSPAHTNPPADILSSSSEKDTAGEHSEPNALLPDLG